MKEVNFFCKVGNTYAIPNVYNNNAKAQRECKIAINGIKQQHICDACALYKNR